jgi:hypothetical protein
MSLYAVKQVPNYMFWDNYRFWEGYQDWESYILMYVN